VAGDGNEKEREPQEAKRKIKRSGTGVTWDGIKMGYVSRVVKVQYWQPYRLDP